MALSHVELYEALKPTVGEKAAQLMADVIPPAKDLVTKHDLAESTAELKSVIAEVNLHVTMLEGEFGKLEARVGSRIDASAKETMRWMLTFFIPVWAGTWGAVLAILLKH